MKMHKRITLNRVLAAIEREQQNCENPGFCLACGADADGCEPDAQGYTCEDCGAPKVYGAEEILMMLA